MWYFDLDLVLYTDLNLVHTEVQLRVLAVIYHKQLLGITGLSKNSVVPPTVTET